MESTHTSNCNCSSQGTGSSQFKTTVNTSTTGLHNCSFEQIPPDCGVSPTQSRYLNSISVASSGCSHKQSNSCKQYSSDCFKFDKRTSSNKCKKEKYNVRRPSDVSDFFGNVPINDILKDSAFNAHNIAFVVIKNKSHHSSGHSCGKPCKKTSTCSGSRTSSKTQSSCKYQSNSSSTSTNVCRKPCKKTRSICSGSKKSCKTISSSTICDSKKTSTSTPTRTSSKHCSPTRSFSKHNYPYKDISRTSSPRSSQGKGKKKNCRNDFKSKARIGAYCNEEIPDFESNWIQPNVNDPCDPVTAARVPPKDDNKLIKCNFNSDFFEKDARQFIPGKCRVAKQCVERGYPCRKHLLEAFGVTEQDDESDAETDVSENEENR